MGVGAIVERARLWAAEKALKGVDLDSSAAFGLLSNILGPTGRPPVRTSEGYSRAYTTHPWLHAVAWRIASSVAAVPFRIYAARSVETGRYIRERRLQRWPGKARRELLVEMKQDGAIEEIVEHPFLDMINDPNPWHVGVAARRLFQVYLDVPGESFAIMDRNVAGVPDRMWPIPPHWVAATPTVRSPFFKVRFGRVDVDVPMSEMLWLFEPDPRDPYGRGIGTARSLGDELDLSEFISKYLRGFFWNNARPDYLLMYEDMSETQKRSLESDFDRHRGFRRRWRPMFLNFVPQIKELSQNLDSLEIGTLSDRQRDTIVQTFGIPPEVLGIIENSNRATIEGAEFLFGRHVLEPRLEVLRDFFQTRLIPEYDERLIVDYDSPVEEDKAFRLDAMKAAPWVPSYAEWREVQGLPETEDEDAAELHALPINVELQRIEETLGVVDADVVPDIRTELASRPTLALPAELGGTKADDAFYRLVHRIADRLEPKVRRILLEAIDDLRRAVDDDALERIAAALAAGKVDAVLAEIPFARLRESLRALRSPLLAAAGAAGAASAAEVADLLDVELSFDDSNPLAIRWAREHAGELIREIEDSTRLGIRALVERSVDGEYDWRKLAREIRDTRIGLTARQQEYVDNFRARLVEAGAPKVDERTAKYAQGWLRRRSIVIARTETINASNMGQQLSWEAGIADGAIPEKRVRKVWIVTPDDALDRTVCEPMPFLDANLDVPVKGLFTTGDGRKIAQPTAHPLCRCATALEVLDEERKEVVARADRLGRAIASFGSEPLPWAA